MSPIAYVMGPSGAGKDALLALARRELAGSTILFAHRFITRDAPAGHENFIGLAPGEFALRARLDLFAFVWEAHGLRYGISREIELWRKTGCSVVISGSRAHFAENLMQRQDVTPILVTAPRELLANRLRQRAREDEAAIALRLQRAAAFPIAHPRLIEIVNDGPLQDAAARLGQVLRAL